MPASASHWTKEFIGSHDPSWRTCEMHTVKTGVSKLPHPVKWDRQRDYSPTQGNLCSHRPLMPSLITSPAPMLSIPFMLIKCTKLTCIIIFFRRKIWLISKNTWFQAALSFVFLFLFCLSCHACSN